MKLFSMRHPWLILLIFLFVIAACHKKFSASTVSTTVAKYDPFTDSSVYTGVMKRYWLVLLKNGPNRNQDSASRAKIQAAHLANIGRLAAAGKIIMAGPMGPNPDLRGIFIMDCKDSTEVAQLLNADTAVLTGRLRMEYYAWWSEKGKYIFK